MDLDEKEMEKTLGVDLERDVVTCEVPFGGMVLLNNCIPHRSLENYSDKVRWSLDFRWQDPKKPTGFYDLKECVIMRKADDPNYKVDWKGTPMGFSRVNCFVSPFGTSKMVGATLQTSSTTKLILLRLGKFDS